MDSGFRKFVIVALVALLAFSGVSGFMAFQTSADLKDAQQEINSLSSQLSTSQNTISGLQNQLGTADGKLNTVNQQIAELVDQQTVVQKAISKVLPSLVYIETYSSSGVASGSGVIMDTEGYILTNRHVVAGATDALVITQDRRIYDVVNIWEDDLMDLAVIKINAHNLTAAQFGDTTNLQLGDTIIALGNPLGYSPADYGSTVTLGIVSNLLSYWVDNDYWYPDLIQFDVFITNGNSGGPLINLDGEVIGINSLGEAAGINYAINSATAEPVYNNLVTYHQGRHPYLGVDIWDYEKPVNGETFATQLLGAEITDLAPGSPAIAAGLRVGDIITSANGETIGLSIDLLRILWRLEAGDSLTLAVDRGASQITVTVQLTLRPTNALFYIF
ncbi:serine protease DegP/HtrA do-like [Dehalogenimonas sp. WBC-2]|nr:serine protease DegP/HtrA do-like [Dehalogenimonas sp. WBC-2]